MRWLMIMCSKQDVEVSDEQRRDDSRSIRWWLGAGAGADQTLCGHGQQTTDQSHVRCGHSVRGRSTHHVPATHSPAHVIRVRRWVEVVSEWTIIASHCWHSQVVVVVVWLQARTPGRVPLSRSSTAVRSSLFVLLSESGGGSHKSERSTVHRYSATSTTSEYGFDVVTTCRRSLSTFTAHLGPAASLPHTYSPPATTRLADDTVNWLVITSVHRLTVLSPLFFYISSSCKCTVWQLCVSGLLCASKITNLSLICIQPIVMPRQRESASPVTWTWTTLTSAVLTHDLALCNRLGRSVQQLHGLIQSTR